MRDSVHGANMRDSVHGANTEEKTIMTTVNRKWSQNVSMHGGSMKTDIYQKSVNLLNNIGPPLCKYVRTLFLQCPTESDVMSITVLIGSSH